MCPDAHLDPVGKSVSHDVTSVTHSLAPVLRLSFGLFRNQECCFLSPATEHLTGHPATALVGTQFLEQIPETHRAAVGEWLADSVSDDTTQGSATFPIRGADGEFRELRLTRPQRTRATLRPEPEVPIVPVLLADAAASSPEKDSASTDTSTLADLIRCWPEPCLYLNRTGTIIDHSDSCREHLVDLGVVRGESFVVPDRDPELVRLALQTSLTSDQIEVLNYAISSQQDTRHFEARFSPLPDGHALVTIRNVKEHHSSDISRADDDRLRHFLRQSKLGMLSTNCEPASRILETNRSFSNMLGYHPNDLIGVEMLELLHPDDRQQESLLFADLTTGKRQTFRVEQRFLHRGGSAIWTRVTCTIVPADSHRLGHRFSIIEDVSQRKAVEQRLTAEQRLLRQLLDLQDRERRLVACEIHDGFTQDVVAAHMMLQAMSNSYKQNDQQTPEELEQALDFLERATNEARRLIDELRPMMLDEMGIVESLHSLVAQERERGSAVIEFVHRVPFSRLPPLLEGTIFRIAQESLNNIRRHSRTPRAEVRLTQVDNRNMVLEIQDYGIGFEIDSVPHDRGGLSGIHERARLFGGGATIESTPGEGTRITVKLPIELPDRTLGDPNVRWTV